MFWSKNIPFSSHTQKSRKTFFAFKLILIKGAVCKFSKKCDESEYNEFLGITKTSDASIVGYTPEYIGFNPSVAVKFDNVILKQIKKDYDSNNRIQKPVRSFITSSLINFRQVWTGSHDSNSNHLKLFLEDNKTKNSVMDLIAITKLAKTWFNMPTLDLSDPSEIPYTYNFNPNSFNGNVTSKVLHSNKKGYTYNTSIQIAMRQYYNVRKTPTKNWTLWTMLAREKDIKCTGKTGKEVGTRLVQTTEEYVIILAGWVFQKLVTSLNSQDSKNIKYHLSGEYDATKAHELYLKTREYDFIAPADWSAFDSSIDTQYLIASCLIMFSNSIKTQEDIRLIYYIMTTVITKYIAVPPGVVIELNRGNSSGHPGVTMVNCVVNQIRWAQIGKEIYGDNFSEYMDIEVYGDDALVMFKKHDNISKLDIIIKKLGFKADPILPQMISTKDIMDNIYFIPDFLKRIYIPGKLYWNREKLFDKLIYQSKKRTVDEQVELIMNFVQTAPGDDEMNNYLDYLLLCIDSKYTLTPEIKERIKIFRSVTLKSVKKHFTPTGRVDGLDGFELDKEVNSLSCAIYMPRYYKNRNIETLDKDAAAALLVSGYSFDYIKFMSMKVRKKITFNPNLFEVRNEEYKYDWKVNTDFESLLSGKLRPP